MKFRLIAALSVTLVAAGYAQTAPVASDPPAFPAAMPKPGSPGGAAVVGPLASIPVTAEVRSVLQMLHDRKDTLKDFTAAIDYNVEDPRSGDATGKRGTVSYITDPSKGPIFSVDFTQRTVDGKPKMAYHAQVIFDGRDLTVKDWGADDKSKTFVRSTLLQPGDKPGDAVTLRGPLPLPIGLDVNDVINTFDVSRVDSKGADLFTLKLVPHLGGHFDYKQLVITIDEKEQLPITLEETTSDGSITTIKFSDIKINPGRDQAKMLDSATPAAAGWTSKDGGASK